MNPFQCVSMAMGVAVPKACISSRHSSADRFAVSQVEHDRSQLIRHPGFQFCADPLRLAVRYLQSKEDRLKAGPSVGRLRGGRDGQSARKELLFFGYEAF
jgi:hypothetical protein